MLCKFKCSIGGYYKQGVCVSSIKNNLLVRLILGISIGILVGLSNVEILVRLLATFNSLFGSFLSFINFGFYHLWYCRIRGGSAKKLLGITVALSYGSTVLVGMSVVIVDTYFTSTIIRCYYNNFI